MTEAFVTPDEWRLTAQEAQVFCAIFEAGGVISRADLCAALGGRKNESAKWLNDRDPKIIDVLLCRLRRKLTQRFDIQIWSLWGVGVEIDAETKARLRAPAQERAA